MAASRFAANDQHEETVLNWQLFLEALAGQAPGFTAADVRKLRLFVGGAGLVGLFVAWSTIVWFFSPPSPVSIRGRLAFQGTPVEQGEIEFTPAPGEQAQRHSIKVEGGAFLLPATQGLLRNKKYVVKAKAYRKTGMVYENAEGSDPVDEYEQYLPSQYNSESQLSFVADRASVAKGLDLDLR
jgi:hypothetical protein